jgi:hypothetical protein
MNARAADRTGFLLGVLLAALFGAAALSSLAAGATPLDVPVHPTQSHIPPTLPGGTPGGIGSISGHVVIDANGNGIADLGEIGFGGATVALDNGGGYRLTTTTDGNGVFGFSSLTDATWNLILYVPPGFVTTGPAAVYGISTAGGQNVVIDFGILEGEASPTAPAAPTREPGTPGASPSPSPSPTLATPTDTATPLPSPTPVDVEATIRAAVQATVRIAQSLQTGIAAVTQTSAARAVTPSVPPPTGTPPAPPKAAGAVGAFSTDLVIASWTVLAAITLLSLAVAFGALRVASARGRDNR